MSESKPTSGAATGAGAGAAAVSAEKKVEAKSADGVEEEKKELVIEQYNPAYVHPAAVFGPVGAYKTLANVHPAALTGKKKRKNWMPLESNPDLLNSYMWKLGVGKGFAFNEVYSVWEQELLSMIPQPVLAVLMLFPVSDASEAHREEEQKRIEKSGQKVSKNVYWMKQVVGNACGTIALLHAVLNNAEMMSLDKGKFFSKFLAETKGLTGIERAKALEENKDIEVEHQTVATQATSSVHHEINDNLHFIAFVQSEGDLYELDGRKEGPINHGKCSDLLLDSAAVIREFMKRGNNDIRFNVAALSLV